MEKPNLDKTGWLPLFNGKDLAGWQGLIPIDRRAKYQAADELKAAQEKADARVLPHWTVVDNVLHYDGKGDSLQTVKDYRNFELRLDWKIDKGGDSGVYLRGTPQVQIWDDPQGSGGLYNNQKSPSGPLVRADLPTGEWNSFRILMKGDRVTVHLNDKMVVNDLPLENFWDRSASLPLRGPIELQHHGGPLWFRNILIRELPD